MIQVFVSHAHEDALLAALVVKFLATFGLGKEHVRCTSHQGYGVKFGAHVSSQLRDDINECRIVVGLITLDGLASSNVLLELGAGWGLKKVLIPVLGPGFDHTNMLPWLVETHWMWWNHRRCWEEFEPLLASAVCASVKSREDFNAAIDELVAYDFAARRAGGP